MQYRSLPGGEGWQVKKLRETAIRDAGKNWGKGANFKKGHVFGQKDTLTNANFSFGEKSFTKKLNED